MLAAYRMPNRIVGLIVNLIVGLILAVVALTAMPLRSLLFAGSPHDEKAPPDLSGVWMERQAIDTLGGAEPPMRPATEAAYRAAKPGYGPHATVDSQDPTLSCFPPGVPRIMLLPFPMQIVQTREETLLIFEYDHFVRQIYMNRKLHPKNLDSTWMGDSIGRWDGDTLVVDTAGLNEKTWLDQSGHPHSSALHVLERIRRIDHNTLVDDITIDDPQAYTKNWTGRQTFVSKPGWHLEEYVCADNINFLEYHRKEVGGSK
jgi:hypothetical protein